MAATQGLAVIAVDPRYTSRYGGTSWQRALSTPTVVARRALGHGHTTRAGRSHTTALPAPTPNLGSGHAWRAVGTGAGRAWVPRRPTYRVRRSDSEVFSHREHT